MDDPSQPVAPETAALLAVVSPVAQRAERLARALARVPDWDLLLSQAQGHGVAVRLFEVFGDLPSPGAPERFRRELEAHAFAVIARNMPRLRQLVELLEALARAGVDALPFKGPALEVRLGRDPLRRESVDLDLLVRRESLAAAAAALVRSGYEPLHPERLRADARRRPLEKHYLFRPPDPSGAAVELHAEVAEPHWAARLPSGDLFARAEPASVGDRDTLQVAAADLLLALSLHGIAHGWRHLLWVGDLVDLLARLAAEQQAAALERSTAHGCRRVLTSSLALLEELLAVRLPSRLAVAVDAEPAARRLAQRMAHRIRRPLGPPGPLRLPLADALRARERLSDRLRMLVGHCRKAPVVAVRRLTAGSGTGPSPLSRA